jgi:hypothetical protein
MVKSGLLFFVFLILFGCASAPQQAEMQAALANYQLPKLPENGKAIVYVVRPSSFGEGFRFNVFIDNQDPKSEGGYTFGRQYIYFDLTPGEHKILSKADYWAETNVSAKAGDIIFIKQDPSMGAVTFNNKLVNLQADEGKYYVKTLALGKIKTTGTTSAYTEQSATAGTLKGSVKGEQAQDSSTSAPATGSSFQQTGTLPVGKAVVYIYHSGGSNHRFFLQVNGKDVTSLRKGQCYTYVAEPGQIEITAKTMGSSSITLDVKTGQAYYLKGSVPPGFSPTPSLVLVSPDAGAQEMSGCKLISSP